MEQWSCNQKNPGCKGSSAQTTLIHYEISRERERNHRPKKTYLISNHKT
jgi:hypothetical protein